MPVPIHQVSLAIGSYLTALYGARNAGGELKLENPWKLLGATPSELGAVADQMVSNGNYFTSYACAGTYELFSVDDGHDMPDSKRQQIYEDLLGPLRRKTRMARSFARAEEDERPAGTRRDGSGRLRLGEKKPAWVRKKFYDVWTLPPTDPELERGLATSLKRLGVMRDRGIAVPFRGELEGVLGRVLDEIRFYQELRREANAAERGGGGRELTILEDYRTLLPIWVYTQRAHADEECNGLPMNLYDLDFWSYRPSAEDGESAGSLPALVESLRKCFEQDAQLAGQGLVERFAARAEELFERCANDDVEGGPSMAFEEGHGVDSPTVRELFGRLRAGEKDVVPAWAQNRAELIWLVMVSSCVGLEAALGSSETRTADELALVETLLDADELGRGSGVVPLGSRVGRRDAGSFDLDLGEDAPEEGAACVLGRERDPRFWPLWAARAKELLGAFFRPETHLDATVPDGLLARLRDDVSARFDASTREGRAALGDFARMEEIGSGRLDVARVLLDFSVRAVEKCLRTSFGAAAESGKGPVLDLGTDERAGAGTLLGAARVAAREFDDFLADELRAQRAHEYARAIAELDEAALDKGERASREQEAERRRDARLPSMRSAVSKRLEYVLRGYFDDQRRLRGCDEEPTAGGGRSVLNVLLDQLEDEYAKTYGHDPSMRLAVAKLRGSLSSTMSSGRVKTISQRKVNVCVDEALVGFGRLEAQRYVTLPSPDVSARHAVVYLSGGRLMLADAGSRQGTAVIRTRRERAGDGVLVHEEALVLEGTERRLDRMLAASWMPADRREVPEVGLRRGDVIRLAGQTVVSVGGAS